MRKVVDDREVYESLKIRNIVTGGKYLKITKPRERWGNSADDGSGFEGRVAVIKHVTHHVFAGRDQRQRPRGWDAKVEHRFAAQKLSHRRSQDRQPVSGSGIRRGASSFELQRPVLRVFCFYFAKINRPAVTKLPCPVSKLMTTVTHRKWIHSNQHRVATKHLGKLRGLALAWLKPD